MQLQIDNLGKVAITVEEDYWSINKDYDKLTIVEQKNVFGTFISRKPVPAGTVLTDRRYWIRFSSLKEEMVLQFQALVNKVNNLEISVDEKEEEIYKAMASITAGGLVLKQTFGDSEVIGISQKAITDKFSDIQTIINRISSDTIGISLNISNKLIFDYKPYNINITVTTNDTKIADNITLKLNGEVVATENDNNILSYNATIRGNSVTVEAIAVKDGFTYKVSDVITSVKPIYVGLEDDYTNVFQSLPEDESALSYEQPIRTTPEGTYVVKHNTYYSEPSGHINVFIPHTMMQPFLKICMNNFPIPMEKFDADDDYTVYVSLSEYPSGNNEQYIITIE